MRLRQGRNSLPGSTWSARISASNSYFETLWRGAGRTRVAQPGEDFGREMPDLRGPCRMVGGHHQRVALQSMRLHVGRYRCAHKLVPLPEQDREHVGARHTHSARHLRQRLSQWDRAIGRTPPEVTAPTWRPTRRPGTRHGAPAAPSTRPRATSTTRSALTTGGGSTAVVSSTCPDGSCSTSDAARWASSSENTSSKRSTGASP